jgi:hypothetical protein
MLRGKFHEALLLCVEEGRRHGDDRGNTPADCRRKRRVDVIGAPSLQTQDLKTQ